MPVTRNLTQVAEATRALTQNLIFEVPALTLTRVDVGGVMQVRLNYPDFKANCAGVCTEFPAGTITLNTADVPAPTNHHVVIPETTGVITVTTTDPDATYGRNAYVYIALVRFQSVAGTEVVFYLRRMYTPTENLLNEFGDFSSDVPYTWVSGAGLTIDGADGTIDLEATNYRRMKFASTLGAITDAVILLDDEATQVANLEAITTYSDGSAITAGKYHKVALLLICSGAADVRLVALRQGVPAVEYATLEAARIDAENVAATVAPLAYYAPTFPLAYVYMLRGDAADLGTIDLREPGFGGGGGGGAVGDHGLLVGLADDDHLQYLNRSGVRAMTGDLDLDGNDLLNAGNVAYGSIFVTAGAAAQAMVANTPALLTAYTTNGPTLNTTPDHTNDRITVTNAGNYRITGAFSFACSAVNQNVRFFAAVGGVAGGIGVQTRTSGANDVYSCSFNGLVTLGAGNVLTVLATTSGAVNLTVSESHLTIERVG